MAIESEIPLSSHPQQPGIVRRFLGRDRVSLVTLLLAVLVGILAGCLVSAFAWGVAWLHDLRMHLAAGSLWQAPLLVAATAALGGLGFWLMRRWAPEAHGSGIPEIEGALDGLRPLRWWRVLPVKFCSGLCVLGSGMIMGREGPSIQMGAHTGQLVADCFRLPKDQTHMLLATGAAAGLAAAFNAPLAGILFIVEEMRPQFRYGLISIKAVFIGAIVGAIVMQYSLGQAPAIDLPVFAHQPLDSLWLFLLLGVLFGALGIGFNRMLLFSLGHFETLVDGRMGRFVGLGLALGALAGLLTLLEPRITGGGIEMITELVTGSMLLWNLLVLLLLRFALTLLFYGSGGPGGIFAPMLALGTLAGLACGELAHLCFPELVTQPGVFAVAGMGALFAATVRAPLTGTVLVLEMTDNYSLILPMIITCLGATMVAQTLGGRPIYSLLLERTLKASLKDKRTQVEQVAEPA